MSIVSYKCPNCGGELTFDPTEQKLKCEYCLSSFNETEVQSLTEQNSHHTSEEEIIQDASDSMHYDTPEDGAYLYTCPSCGAEIITEATTSATHCWYCHTPVVLSKQLTNEFRPSKIIPFQKSKEQALETFKNWCSHKKFLPDNFCSPRQLENINGLYVPYWLVDCKANGSLKGTGHRLKSWRSGDYLYTKTDIFSIARSAEMSFSYLPHDASKKAEDKVMESISPFNYNELRDFSYIYLSGFLAEKYDVTKEEIYPIIKQRVENAVRSELHSSVHGYSSTAYGSEHVGVHHTLFHYALMPVWILTYQYKDTTYLYAMNGQTGKTFGSMPIDINKVNKCTLIVFGISFIILLTIILCSGGINL